MKQTKARTKEDHKPIPILKKSESSQAIRTDSLFDNQQLQSLKHKQPQLARNTGSVHSSFQETLKEQLRRLRKKENGDKIVGEGQKNIREQRRSLGHQLIEEIRELSQDDVVVTKVVVEFMESVSAQSDREIVSHFKSMLSLIVRAVKSSVKREASERQKEILEKKNSLKRMMINSKTIEDQFQDAGRELRLYKDLLEEQKEKSRTFEVKLSKTKKINSELEDQLETLHNQVQQLKIGNGRLETELSLIQAELKKIKGQRQLEQERLHCLRVENDTLYQNNKELERQLFSINKQSSSLKSNTQARAQELRTQSREWQRKYQSLERKYSELQADYDQAQGETNQQLLEERERNESLNQQIVSTEARLQEAISDIESLESKYQMLRKREAELDGKVETLEYERLKLNSQLKSIYHSQDSKPSPHPDQQILPPPPSPHFQEQPPTLERVKSIKKLKALEDIQALIRKHKASE